MAFSNKKFSTFQSSQIYSYEKYDIPVTSNSVLLSNWFETPKKFRVTFICRAHSVVKVYNFFIKLFKK
jgi:hypothetical protein